MKNSVATQQNLYKVYSKKIQIMLKLLNETLAMINSDTLSFPQVFPYA